MSDTEMWWTCEQCARCGEAMAWYGQGEAPPCDACQLTDVRKELREARAELQAIEDGALVGRTCHTCGATYVSGLSIRNACKIHEAALAASQAECAGLRAEQEREDALLATVAAERDALREVVERILVEEGDTRDWGVLYREARAALAKVPR